WHGDYEARRAVYNNRAQLLSGVARQAFRLRAELVERGFALILDRGGMRRAGLRGRENIQKGYLLESAEFSATFRRPIACARSLRATAPWAGRIPPSVRRCRILARSFPANRTREFRLGRGVCPDARRGGVPPPPRSRVVSRRSRRSCAAWRRRRHGPMRRRPDQAPRLTVVPRGCPSSRRS